MVALILRDNIFHDYGFTQRLRSAANINDGATIFGYHVSNPKEFGVGIEKTIEWCLQNEECTWNVA